MWSSFFRPGFCVISMLQSIEFPAPLRHPLLSLRRSEPTVSSPARETRLSQAIEQAIILLSQMKLIGRRGDHPRRRSRRTSSRKRHRPHHRPPVGVGERARCPALFQRSRPCPHPRNERRRRPPAERWRRSPALAERASRRSRPSSRGSWGRHFHYSSIRTQLRISRRTRRCPRAPTPRAWRAT